MVRRNSLWRSQISLGSEITSISSSRMAATRATNAVGGMGKIRYEYWALRIEGERDIEQTRHGNE